MLHVQYTWCTYLPFEMKDWKTVAICEVRGKLAGMAVIHRKTLGEISVLIFSNGSQAQCFTSQPRIEFPC